MTSDPLPSEFSITTLALQLISLFFYMLLWFRVKLLWKGTTANPMKTEIGRCGNEHFTDRILKSLMVIFCIEFAGWAGNMAVKNVLEILHVDSETQWYIMSVVGRGLRLNYVHYYIYVAAADFEGKFL